MLSACIIGTGRIASTLEKDPLRHRGCSHAGAYSLNPDTRLIAGADVDPRALQEFGSDWSLPADALYADYRAMLAERRPDIASVAAYAPERREMALAALASGAKGLWLEKAVGCSVAEAEDIEQAARQAGAAAVVDYPRRGRAPYRKIKEIVDTGAFGKLLAVTCHMTPQVIHTGTHAFDVLRFWCGEALEVSGRLEPAPAPGAPIADQGGSAEILMSSGAVAFIDAYPKRYYIFQFDLVFEDARILIGNDIQKLYRPATSRNYTGYLELFEQARFDWGKPHARDMLGELVHAIRTGEEPIFSLRNATESLRIALAIFESHRRGRRVSLDKVDPTLHVPSV